MLQRVDHIDLRVKDVDATVETLKKLGLAVLRQTPEPRCSVEMALPGEGQVVFELRPSQEFQGVHHVAFKSEEPGEVALLKEQGIAFLTENLKIEDTGRTVSSFADGNGIVWQLTD